MGYAKADYSSGYAPYGIAVFSFRQNGVTVSETGVPASAPITRGRIFIEYSFGAGSITGQSGAGTVDINTGIAIVNCGSAVASINYTLRDLNGIIVAQGHGIAASGNHFAKFINQLKEVAPDFNLPLNFPTTIRFGSLEVTSDQPLSMMAIRGTINQRDEFLMTTIPAADLAQSLSHSFVYYPQFADGDGYTTSFFLLNTSDEIQTGALEILDNDGTPLAVSQVAGMAESVFRYFIPTGGVLCFRTDGSPAIVKTGWVRLVPDPGTSTPVGSGVIGYTSGNILVSESGCASPKLHQCKK